MFINESEFQKVIKGNIKKKRTSRNVVIYLEEEAIKKLDVSCEEIGIHRNKYVGLILDHYWKCKNK